MAAVGSGWQFYVTLLLVYLGVDVIACLGLNIQLCLAGVMDFAFIIFQAAGAYVYAIFTLGPPNGALGLAAGGQRYFWGAQLPFPLPFLLATVAGPVLRPVPLHGPIRSGSPPPGRRGSRPAVQAWV